jgi:hypothetical protein
MPSVRITTDWGHRDRMEWAGAPGIGKDGKIERSIDIPEEAFQGIEAGIRKGFVEGNFYLKDKSRFSWFLDR